MPRGLLAAFAALWALAWLWAARGLAPIQDEAYYWTWSRALAARYFDHPPGIAWVMAGSTAVFGDGVLGLRAPSALAVVIVLACAAALAGASRRALVVAMLCGAPMFAVGYVPGTHDALLGAAMAVSALLVRRALVDPRWTTAAAFVLAASVLIKHAAAVVALGVVAGLLTTPLGRARLAMVRTWAGAFAGMLAALPWLVAELAAAGGSIVFQAAHVLDYAPPRPLVGGPLALGSMVLTLGPVAGVGVWLAAVSGLRGTVEGDADPATRALWAALGGGALALLVACVVAVMAGSGEANWPMPALALSAPLVAAWISARPRVARVAMPAAAVSACVCALLLTHAGQPWIPARVSRDPTLRGAGMDTIAAEVERVAHLHGARALVTRRYQPASLLRYHLGDRWPLVELGTPRRKSQYDVWPRPSACAGDVVVWTSTHEALPYDLPSRQLGTAARIWRPAWPGGPGVDAWSIQALELTEDRAGSVCPSPPRAAAPPR